MLVAKKREKKKKEKLFSPFYRWLSVGSLLPHLARPLRTLPEPSLPISMEPGRQLDPGARGKCLGSFQPSSEHAVSPVYATNSSISKYMKEPSKSPYSFTYLFPKLVFQAFLWEDCPFLSWWLFLATVCCSQCFCLYVFLTKSHQESHLSPGSTSSIEMKASLYVSPPESSKTQPQCFANRAILLSLAQEICHMCGLPSYGCNQSGKWEMTGRQWKIPLLPQCSKFFLP